MSYVKDKLVGRPGYGTSGPPMSGFGDDDVPWYQKLLGGAASGFATQQTAQQGTVAAETAAALAAQNQGTGIGTIALVGALGVGAFLILRKKKT